MRGPYIARNPRVSYRVTLSWESGRIDTLTTHRAGEALGFLQSHDTDPLGEATVTVERLEAYSGEPAFEMLASHIDTQDDDGTPNYRDDDGDYHDGDYEWPSDPPEPVDRPTLAQLDRAEQRLDEWLAEVPWPVSGAQRPARRSGQES